MGGVRREKGVLKLVRPGGVVEIHNHPITAAQVMEMYPRHCVTRPDVFKYPWIVVRPESVLSLDRVFYVVPCHTIRRLLQLNGLIKGSKTQDDQTLAKAEESGFVKESDEATLESEVVSRKYDKERVKNACLLPVIEPSSFRKLARVSPENTAGQTHEERRKGRLNTKFSDRYLFQETFPANQNDDPILKKKHQKKKYPVDNSLIMIDYKNPKQNVRPQTKVGSLVEERASCQPKVYNSDDDAQGCFPLRRNASNLEPKKSTLKVTTSLKPCLKKHRTKNTNTSQGPRVTFVFPEDDHNEKWGIGVSDS